MTFFSFYWDILISSLKNIPLLISNYSPCKAVEVRNYENMVNTLKIKVFLKSILFCKYLHNGSSDPDENVYAGQYLSCERMYQI